MGAGFHVHLHGASATRTTAKHGFNLMSDELLSIRRWFSQPLGLTSLLLSINIARNFRLYASIILPGAHPDFSLMVSSVLDVSDASFDHLVFLNLLNLLMAHSALAQVGD